MIALLECLTVTFGSVAISNLIFSGQGISWPYSQNFIVPNVYQNVAVWFNFLALILSKNLRGAACGYIAM